MRTVSLLLILLALGPASTGCKPDEGADQAKDGSLDEVAGTARLVYLEGSVRVKRSTGLDWVEAREGTNLAVNDRVRTLRDSFATIEFEEGGTLRIGPESLVTVTDLRLEPRNQAQRSTFTVVEGRVEAELDSQKPAGSEFKIKTPSAEAAVVHREVSFQ